MPGRARSAATVVANELRRLGRDRLGLFFILVLPFVIIIAIGSFIPDADVSVVVAVVDQDRSSASRELTEALGGVDGVEVRTGFDRREAERELRIQQLSGVLVLPEAFGEAIDAEGATVEVVVDPAASSARLVQSTVAELLAERSARLAVTQVLLDAGVVGTGAGSADGLAAEALGQLEPSEVEVQVLGGEEGQSNYAFVAAGQMILFMFVNLLAAGAGFIEIRRLGILGRITAGPVDAGDVLAGMGVARFFVATGLAAMIVALSVLVYDVDWGSWAVLVSVVVLFGFVSVGASALIGALFDKPDSATSVGIPLGLGMAALGGCMFPLFLAPQAMQVVAKVLTPHAWAVDALLDASYDGAGLAEVWENLAVLALWAVVLGGLARVLARRKLRG
jgi:ABC-2 type transport system permease protein